MVERRTALQRQIEERSGRPLPQLIAELVAESGSVRGAATLIQRRYNCRVSYPSIYNWLLEFGGEVEFSARVRWKDRVPA